MYNTNFNLVEMKAFKHSYRNVLKISMKKKHNNKTYTDKNCFDIN